MENKELSIQTLAVEIRVLVVDGKRFTKSVFNQLPIYTWRMHDMAKPQVKAVGFVKIPEGKYIIAIFDGALFKMQKTDMSPNTLDSEFAKRWTEPEPGYGNGWSQWNTRKDTFLRSLKEKYEGEYYEMMCQMNYKDQLFISI